MHCTVPALLRAWFDKHFYRECEWHDARYVVRDIPKTVADFLVSYKMARKYKWSWWLILAFPVLLVHPKAYILWYKDENGAWVW